MKKQSLQAKISATQKSERPSSVINITRLCQLSMDSFVINTLTDWQLTDLLESFKEEGIDEESFLLLDEATINQLIPRAGPRLKFLKKFRGLVR